MRYIEALASNSIDRNKKQVHPLRDKGLDELVSCTRNHQLAVDSNLGPHYCNAKGIVLF